MISMNSVSITPQTIDTGQVFVISVSVTSSMKWSDMIVGTWEMIKRATWGKVKG